MKKLLNIDGGGVRVYFSILILNYIEEKTGKEIIDLFDYYSGVSASSILLSALLTKYKLKDIIQLFKDTFGGTNYPTIAKPEICNGLEKILVYSTEDEVNSMKIRLTNNVDNVKTPLQKTTSYHNALKSVFWCDFVVTENFYSFFWRAFFVQMSFWQLFLVTCK